MINLDDATAQKLLDKLSSDDDFRSLFVKDPAEALRSLGPTGAKFSAAATCMKVAKLADKDAIASSRDALTKMLVTQLASHSAPQLDTKI
ncbi:NHLP-related RiPP peptide [Pseudomarimonas arenosa]|uniref:NHLP-related RiPP peptide n=1 Tax=Pseudomarimonas arenosa TaxID=2774145 RepID=A0AAW3ZMA1_9GAMM|nr:NHLP-related RiPP peptide [Pseudomarimonas arenosa]MBD8525779.1 NHLP-related RiPP peptide [Pseudomarimonas arenosa]